MLLQTLLGNRKGPVELDNPNTCAEVKVCLFIFIRLDINLPKLVFQMSQNFRTISAPKLRIIAHNNSSRSVFEWLESRAFDQHDLRSKPTSTILLFPWEDILRHFSLLGGLGKHFLITVISLLNYKRTAISWHLRKQVGVIAYLMY